MPKTTNKKRLGSRHIRTAFYFYCSFYLFDAHLLTLLLIGNRCLRLFQKRCFRLRFEFAWHSRFIDGVRNSPDGSMPHLVAS